MTEIGRRALASESLIRAIKIGGSLSLLSVTATAAPNDSGPPVARPIVPSIDIKVLGAIGDGEADDTPAFRAALVAGTAIYVPPGTYRLTGPLQLDGVTLFGAGPSSILKCANPNNDLLEVGGTGVRIQNLSIWGTATDETTDRFGVITSKTSPPHDFALTEVTFSGASPETGLNNGIKFEDKATNCRIENCHFERLIGTSSGHGYAILTGAVDGLLVTGNTFEGSRESRQGRHAVYVSAGGKRVTASHNIIRDFNFEAMCTNAYLHQQPVEQIIYAQNLIHRCGGDGSNQSSISITGKARTIRVEGNVVVESFGCGILCDAGSVVQENISVDNNTIIDSAYMGIRQLGALQQTVRNNYVRGSSRNKPGTWADIVVGAAGFAPEQILVSGNQCVPVPDVSFRPFILNASRPFPSSVKLFGNDFPATGYKASADYAAGVMQPLIDGRLQFRSQWQPPPLIEKAVATHSFLVVGAEPGDIVGCTHPAANAGIILSAFVETSDRVVVTLINHGGTRTELPGGMLAIDVWKTLT